MSRSRWSRAALAAAGCTLVACSESASPDRLLGPDSVSRAKAPAGGGGGAGGAGGGGGGGGGGINFQTPGGLYLVDNPSPGEASVAGYVLPFGPSGSAIVPDNVTINGVPLVHSPTDVRWYVDPAGPQPVIGSNLAMTIRVSSGGSAKSFTFSCAARVAFATTPAAGASLAGVDSVRATWTKLPQNATNNAFFPQLDRPHLILYPYDAASNTATTPIAETSLTSYAGLFGISQTDLGATVATLPATSTGFGLELKFAGLLAADPAALDGLTIASCGRKERLVFTD
jgi:hypothetical protein